MTEPGDRRGSVLRVAVVHEWLTNRAGSERCVEAIVDAFPDHQLYTTLHQRDLFPTIEPDRVVTSALQRAFDRPFSHLQAGPLLPFAMRSLRVDDGADAAIYSFHHFATQVRVPSDLPTLAYVYTPPRFIHRAASLRAESGSFLRAGLGVGLGLRRADRRRLLESTTEMVAISHAVAQRCADAYGFTPRVIHPPVDVDVLAPRVTCDNDDYFLLVGRLVPYKRPDLAVEAFAGMPDLKLKVVGAGRMADQLARDASDNVELLGYVSDEEVHTLLAGARGAILPAEEDFGIAAVEALAAGCPVVALNLGGARDFVEPGRNGFAFDEATTSSLQAAVRQLIDEDLDRHDIASSAKRFSRDRFQAELIEVVETMVDEQPRRLADRIA